MICSGKHTPLWWRGCRWCSWGQRRGRSYRHLINKLSLWRIWHRRRRQRPWGRRLERLYLLGWRTWEIHAIWIVSFSAWRELMSWRQNLRSMNWIVVIEAWKMILMWPLLKRLRDLWMIWILKEKALLHTNLYKRWGKSSLCLMKLMIMDIINSKTQKNVIHNF